MLSRRFSRNNSKMSDESVSYPSTTLYRDFKIVEILGKGGFGEIVKATRLSDNYEFAIKIIKFVSSMEDVGNYRREAKHLSRLDHPNIVRYYNSWIETAHIPLSEYKKMEFDDNESSLSSEIYKLSKEGYLRQELEGEESDGNYEDEIEEETDSQVCFYSEETKEIKYLFIQMELCEKRTLRTEIENDLYLDEDKLTKYFKQICEGLSHIHKKYIVHRDLKPENIFLTSSNEIKIGDFGLSKQFAEDSTVDQLPFGSLSDACGTSIYIAPELKDGNNKKFNIKADIYSLGVTYFEMCSKPMTFMEKHITFPLSSEKIKSVQFQKNSKTKKELIGNLLHLESNKRPTCNDILKLLNLDRSPDEIKEFFEQNRKVPYQQFKTFEKILKSKSMHEMDLMNYFIQKAVKVFELHGAHNIPIPTFLPSFNRYSDNFTTFLNARGNSVSVSNSSRISFSFFVEKNNITNMRRYSIAKTFEEGYFLPSESQECLFEVINEEPDDFVTDAEMLYMIQEICENVYPENHRQVHFFLNHRAIFSSILRFCDITEKYYSVFTNTMMKISKGTANESDLFALLNKLDITPEKKSFIVEMRSLYSAVAAEQIVLPKIKGKNRSTAKLFKVLQQVVENANKFGIKKENIFLSPLLITNKYCSGLMFKAELTEDQTVVAVGDESLLNKFTKRNQRNKNVKLPSSVGVSFNTTNILRSLKKYYSANIPGVDILIYTNEKSKVIPLYKKLLSLEVKCQITSFLDFSSFHKRSVIIQYLTTVKNGSVHNEAVIDCYEKTTLGNFSKNPLYRGNADLQTIVEVVVRHYYKYVPCSTTVLSEILG